MDKNIFQRLGFVPRYNEVTLFLTASTFLLLLATNKEIVEIILNMGGGDIRNALFVSFFMIGLIAAIYYALSSKETPQIMKHFMLLFVIITNLGVAVYAFIHFQKHNDIFLIFPALNVLSAVFMYLLFRAKVIDEECISDENARHLQILVGLAALIAVFLTSQYLLKNYWAITFSMCLTYASLVNDVVTKTILRG